MSKFKAELLSDGYVRSVLAKYHSFMSWLRRSGLTIKRLPRVVYTSIADNCFSTPLRFKYTARTVCIVAAAISIAFLALLNADLFTQTVTLSSSMTNGDFTYIPSNRYAGFQTGTITVENQRLYFTAVLPRAYDTASVRITYQSSNPDQLLSLGYQQQNQNFTTQYIDVPYLNGLTQAKISGSNLYAYSKSERDIGSMNLTQVFSFAIQNGLNIGSLGVDQASLQANTAVPGDYYATQTPTTIRPALRGSATFYMYLEKEPLHLSLTKQALNFEASPDKVGVAIYNSQGARIYSGSIGNGRNDGTDRIAGEPQTLDIDLGGTKPIASGTYKVVVTGNNDSLLSQVQANTNKIVFDSPLYWAGNSPVYGLGSASNPYIYSNASLLSVATQHAASLQTVGYGTGTVTVSALNHTYFVKTPADGLQAIVSSRDDLMLDANGFYAFNPSQFFVPYANKVIQAATTQGLSNADIILTQYTKPTVAGGSYQTKLTYPLQNVYYPKKNIMVWRLSSNTPTSLQDPPKIKRITITFTKKGWLHL